MSDLLLSAATILVGVIVWFVRLEGRVNAHDQILADLKARLVRIENLLLQIHRTLNGS